ncbi:MAG: hypothetical protein GX859_06630 [Corynebacterium humireducens]|jgi:hypothetical protein|uniref:Uncharacterized protein n=1 Tax=Corynebacterium humireducens TaxID=1223514 RepID=A0A7X6SW99_9CORY|nr:hypothetical protein [Corynebacterium humireducens]
MSFSVKDALAARDIHPSPEHLTKLEAMWEEIQSLKQNLDVVPLDDADLAVRSIPGGDHVDQ